MMCICPERDPRSFGAGELEQTHVQILSIGIAIDLECLVEFSRLSKDAPPICGAGSVKTRLTPKPLAALNEQPKRVMFPQGDAR